MTVLDATARARVLAQWQRDNRLMTGTVTKAQLAQAVGEVDDWIEANTASLNTAINATARAALSTQQKYDLFMFVMSRRVGRLHAEEDG